MTNGLFQTILSCAIVLIVFALGYMGRELRDLRKSVYNDVKHIIEDIGIIKGRLGIDD